jgi:hypothetical protein
MVDNRSYSESFGAVVKAAMLIIVLFILKAVARSLPGTDTEVGPLAVSEYIRWIVSIGILVVLLGVSGKLKVVVSNFISKIISQKILAKSEKAAASPDRIAGSIVALVYLIIIYAVFLPVLSEINYQFIGFDEFETIVKWAALVFGLYMLVMLWKNAQPLIDVTAAQITTRVTGQSHESTVACRICDVQNEVSAKFCKACGKAMA